jgi:tripartite-type tricarboxylate transporter receptor subunit TctC
VPVVVENLAGASTVIGADKVAKSPPDGYTILITTTTTFATNPHTLKSMPFSIDDFEGVSLLAQNPLVLAAPASAIYNTPKDLVEYARANPGKLSYGTQGRGATAHFVGEMIASALGIKMTDVSYKGSTPGLVDLSGGQIPLLVDGTVASLPLVKAGRIKLIGVTSSERLSAAPNVPTFVESGYPEMVADFKTAMFVPKGTPQSVIDKLNTAVQYALSDKALVDRYGQNGTMVKGSDPRETVQTFKRDREMYGRLIERTGLKFD